MTAFSRIGKVSILLLTTVLLMSFTTFANPFDQVVKALERGKVENLAPYFDSMIEISVGGKNNSYSKSQASVILKSFFVKNSVVSFKVIHKGTSKDGAHFGIGKMTTTNGTYRVTFFFRQKGGSVVLQELRFKKDT